jgi:hypothetical protein
MIGAALLVAILGTGLWFGWRRIRFAKRAMSLNWPSGMTADDVYRHTLYYLRQSGWIIYEPWPWLGVRIRAGKQHQWLMLVIADTSLKAFKTVLSDTAYNAAVLGRTLTVLVHGVHPAEIAATEVPRNLLVLTAADLPNAAELLYKHSLAMPTAPDDAPMTEAEKTEPLRTGALPSVGGDAKHEIGNNA